MTNTQRLLERLRKIADPPTDYQIGKLLGATPQSVHQWLKEGTAMDLTTSYVLADLLKEDRAIVAGMTELDRKNLSAEKRAKLEHMLPRRVASAGVAFLVGLAANTTMTGRTQAEALVDVSREHVAVEQVHQFTDLYIMRSA